MNKPADLLNNQSVVSEFKAEIFEVQVAVNGLERHQIASVFRLAIMNDSGMP